MSEPLVRPIVLDATVLSNFASTDSVMWLATTLKDFQTVPAVRTELENGREAGYTYLNHALSVLESGDIGVVETAPEQLQQDYPEIEDRLDPGEAEALVATHSRWNARDRRRDRPNARRRLRCGTHGVDRTAHSWSRLR